MTSLLARSDVETSLQESVWDRDATPIDESSEPKEEEGAASRLSKTASPPPPPAFAESRSLLL